MGNFVIAGDFFAYETDDAHFTVYTEDDSYPKENVGDYWFLKKQWRATGATENQWYLKFDFGAATYQPLAAVFLNDVNFDKVMIEGHASDSWGAPSFQQTFAVSKDLRVNRHKAYCSLTTDGGFDYQWMRIVMPTGATVTEAFASGGTAWRIGTVAILTTDTDKTIEFTVNPAYPYRYAASQTFMDIVRASGSKSRIGLGNNLYWSGDITFDLGMRGNEDELWKVNALDIAQPVVFYENLGHTQHAYLATRDNAMSISMTAHNAIQTETVRFTEIV